MGGETIRLKEVAEATVVVVDSVVYNGGLCDVDEQLGMEKTSLYLEVAEEDMRKGLHRAVHQLENQWRD